MKKIYRLVLASLMISPAGFFPSRAEASKLIEDANPFPKISAVRQHPDENICWAISAALIMHNVRRLQPKLCEVVGRTRGENCCVNGNDIAPACNKGGQTANALRAYGVPSTWSAVDYERAFDTIRRGGLVGLSLDVNEASYGSREGHAAVVYRAKKFSDGEYQFFVADSASRDLFYSFRTGDLRTKKDGKIEYISLDRTFTWESMLLVYP